MVMTGGANGIVYPQKTWIDIHRKKPSGEVELQSFFAAQEPFAWPWSWWTWESVVCVCFFFLRKSMENNAYSVLRYSMYMYVYMYICVYVYIYMYVYM